METKIRERPHHYFIRKKQFPNVTFLLILTAENSNNYFNANRIFTNRFIRINFHLILYDMIIKKHYRNLRRITLLHHF